MAILPADLDAVIWFDLERLRALWSYQPNVQLANVLREYGVIGRSDDELTFWTHFLSRSERLWVACRPALDGCHDTVAFARGNFRKYEPTLALPKLHAALDLGAGWLRYDRAGRTHRDQAARIYLAPPDRCVVAPVAELDAIERRFEQGGAESAPTVEERGLFSIALRASTLAELLESRSPAAARLMRSAESLKLWLDPNAGGLELVVIVGFQSHEHAERARAALAVVAKAIGLHADADAGRKDAIELLDRDVVFRAQLSADAHGLPANREKKLEPALQ